MTLCSGSTVLTECSDSTTWTTNNEQLSVRSSSGFINDVNSKLGWEIAIAIQKDKGELKFKKEE